MTGALVRVGGPAPGLPAPLPGRIEAVDSNGNEVIVSAGRNGRFKLELAPGTYKLTGNSPLIQQGKMICSAAKPVHVTRTARIAKVLVICSIR
ncbi:MAG: hypothetical protein ACTHJW_26850 [Streptosporangiaceae bacterium]